MALINCKECNNEVSTTAKTCPKCGAKVQKDEGKVGFIGYGGLVLVVIALLNMCSSPNENKNTATALLRNDLEATVIGKTPDEVIAAIGRPNSTQHLTQMDIWSYNNLTKDPISGKLDRTTQVVFENGRVGRFAHYN
jgi:hypothetical protein